jgi:tRNA(fMet)-specific endonuclease VapC
MLRYMLDSSFCIDVMRGKQAALRDRLKSNRYALSVSTIVVHELLYGAANGSDPVKARSKTEEFFAAIAVMHFDENAAAHSGEIRAELRKQGQLIGAYDMLIAGHARSLGLTVVTSNMKDFTRVDGLRCEDWLAEAGI